jgi:peptidoglycan/LPS O-acetylase OafA/YrhL
MGERPRIILANVLRGRDNNLNLIRFLAATAVVYTHAFGIAGSGRLEPIQRVVGIGTGDLGVDVCFFISGFLDTRSFENSSLGPPKL